MFTSAITSCFSQEITCFPVLLLSAEETHVCSLDSLPLVYNGVQPEQATFWPSSYGVGI